MSYSKDSILYCSKCKNKPTCIFPCYPVERLLDSVTKPATEIPINYADQIEISPSEAFVPPESWTRKSTKRKVFDLCFIDNLTQQHTANLIGITRQRVNQIAIEILSLIDNL